MARGHPQFHFRKLHVLLFSVNFLSLDSTALSVQVNTDYDALSTAVMNVKGLVFSHGVTLVPRTNISHILQSSVGN